MLTHKSRRGFVPAERTHRADLCWRIRSAFFILKRVRQDNRVLDDVSFAVHHRFPKRIERFLAIHRLEIEPHHDDRLLVGDFLFDRDGM